MFLFLFGLWICLNGRATPDVFAAGLVAAALVYAFCRAFLGYRPLGVRMSLRIVRFFLLYLLLLVKEMVVTGLRVIKLVLSPHPELRPCLMKFQPGLHTVPGRVLLANSITLTPGTIPVDLTEDGCWVHGLNEKLTRDVAASPFISLIRKMEEKQ